MDSVTSSEEGARAQPRDGGGKRKRSDPEGIGSYLVITVGPKSFNRHIMIGGIRCILGLSHIYVL